MPLVDITKPEIISFLIESYDKTTRLRARWNSLHQKKLQQAATFTREEKGLYDTDVIESAMAAGLPAIRRDHVTSALNRRLKYPHDSPHVLTTKDLKKDHTIPKVGLGDPKIDPRLEKPDDDYSLDPIMRPVDPKHSNLIYKGIPNFGRQAYLKARNHLKPEDKYYFREGGGWEYGWRLKDSYFGRHKPKYGRVFRLTHGNRSRTGPQPDPPHYNSSTIPGVSKCLRE